MHGLTLPTIVSTAGTVGKHVLPPHQVSEDTFAPDSYWWLFRRLMDVVKGDAIRSVPGYYAERNHIVRARFDELEQHFAAELPHVLNEVIAAQGTDGVRASAHLLDEFTEHCVDRVVNTAKELLETFGDQSFVSSTAK